MENRPEVMYPLPDVNLFKKPKSAVQNVIAEDYPVFEYEKTIYSDQGVFVYHKGPLYPERGMVTPELVANANIVKRLVMGTISILGLPEVLACISLLFFFPWKYKIRIIEKYIKGPISSARLILESHPLSSFYKPEHYADSCRELRKLTYLFLTNLGVQEEPSNDFSELLCHLVEADSAYRYRMEDLFSVTSKEAMLENPRREIKRMIAALARRERISLTVKTKGKAIANLMSLILLLPKVKKSFRNAVKELDFKKLQLDHIDRYHCLKFDGYDFWDAPIQERLKEYILLHGGQPPVPKSLSQRQAELQEQLNKMTPEEMKAFTEQLATQQA